MKADDAAPRQPWLQRELLQRLVTPVLVIVALTALLGVLAAQRLVERVYDRWLLDAARSLAAQVRIDAGNATVILTKQAEEVLLYDIVDEVFFEVMQDQRHLIGSEGVPAQGTRESTFSLGGRAYDALYLDKPTRVAWVPVQGSDGHVVVLVAETLLKRQRAQRDLLLAMAPLGLLVVAAPLVVWMTVRRTLRPLERIAARWNQQSHDSVEAIPTQDVPRELLPFASALNDLLSRLRTTLERERAFAATAAHQLRSPLTSLRLGLARASEASDLESARAVMAELGQSTQKAARLIQQLLTLGRLDLKGVAVGPRSDIDLVALARSVGESYLDEAMAKKIELEFEEPTSPVRAPADPELLSEALGNIIDNALQYTPAGGRIVITVDLAPATLTVADSGPGIPVEERLKVLERFTRGSSATGSGSGLGLAVAREIAELHGADLRISDGRLGGVQFSIQFRRADPPRSRIR